MKQNLLKSKIIKEIGCPIFFDPIYRYSYARDASFYRLIPKAVIQPINKKDIISLFTFANKYNTPLTFRAAGTSLSGQSITNHLLVDISQSWKKFHVHKNGDLITSQPSVIGGHLNNTLKKFNKKIGPDPASIQSCFIGGIISNNASGMCCGISNNSYHTLKSMKFILPNGTEIDTSLSNSDESLKNNAPELFFGVQKIKSQIDNNESLRKMIEKKYLLKNTMGYSLNSFLDFDTPTEIISHLMVGSEGTLGFISEATLSTILDPNLKATGLVLFNSLSEACAVIPELKKIGISACEIMDHSAFTVMQTSPNFPYKQNILPKNGAVLLCEFQSNNEIDLTKKIQKAQNIISSYNLTLPFSFTQSEKERNQLWAVRKGMLPCHAGLRKKGTTLIIEDVCVKVENLAPAIQELHLLFQKYNYDDAVLFGHAIDGNLHFNISSDFSTSKGIENYRLFMDDVVQLINEKYNGSLKAEHGTGRNMAPFLEREWGEEAGQIMRKIKRLFDPNNILNPGVIFTKDPLSHIKNIKPIPSVDPIIDPCIECGFCESNCPSKNITMTPRRRINILRELDYLKSIKADKSVISSIEESLSYHLNDTCATDGLCSASCPVNINTGELVKLNREEQNYELYKKIAFFSAKHFKGTTNLIQVFLKLVNEIGGTIGWRKMKFISSILNQFTNRKIPVFSQPINILSSKLRSNNYHNSMKRDLIYFPSCLARNLQPNEKNNLSIPETIRSLCEKAGFEPIIPKNINSLCCGMPYLSKGYRAAYDAMAEKNKRTLLRQSKNNKIIITDNSPCTNTLQNTLNPNGQKNIEVLNPISFLRDLVIPNTKVNKKFNKIFYHSPCSMEGQGDKSDEIDLIKYFGKQVDYPQQTICCGFAGDLGFFIPQLMKSATTTIKDKINLEQKYNQYCSTSITCEMGLTQSTGKDFQSILSIANKCLH